MKQKCISIFSILVILLLAAGSAFAGCPEKIAFLAAGKGTTEEQAQIAAFAAVGINNIGCNEACGADCSGQMSEDEEHSIGEGENKYMGKNWDNLEGKAVKVSVYTHTEETGDKKTDESVDYQVNSRTVNPDVREISDSDPKAYLAVIQFICTCYPQDSAAEALGVASYLDNKF